MLSLSNSLFTRCECRSSCVPRNLSFRNSYSLKSNKNNNRHLDYHVDKHLEFDFN